MNDSMGAMPTMIIKLFREVQFMKKFINQVENVELEMLEGIAKAHPQHLKKLPENTVLVRANKKEGKVALISGGGSGHEPAHGGYVGEGMLDAAVAGAVFT